MLCCPAQAASAGGEAWQEYFQLFAESRFVHVTSADFAALCLFAPFWMWNDAEKRQWQSRCSCCLCSTEHHPSQHIVTIASAEVTPKENAAVGEFMRGYSST
jgi:hypothetical protein